MEPLHVASAHPDVALRIEIAKRLLRWPVHVICERRQWKPRIGFFGSEGHEAQTVLGGLDSFFNAGRLVRSPFNENVLYNGPTVGTGASRAAPRKTAPYLRCRNMRDDVVTEPLPGQIHQPLGDRNIVHRHEP